MKSYKCKLCSFGGTRKGVRKHIVEYHKIKGKPRNIDRSHADSDITPLCIGTEI